MSLPPISDPVRIRALSHPLRIRLLDALDDGDKTASECAALTGESVASCSFHLRTLAKYGFIERAAPRGREKPWTVIGGGLRVDTTDGGNGINDAAATLAGVVLEHAAESARAWIATLRDPSDGWNQASVMSRVTCWATQDELRELGEEITRLLERYQERNQDPSSRPDTARPVHAFAALHPDVRLEARDDDGPAT